MKRILRVCLLKNLWFYLLTFVSVCFLFASFIVPPTGELHPSVLKAVGEIFGFSALGVVVKAIDNDAKAVFKHGDTSLSLDASEGDEREEGDNSPSS